MKYSKFEKIASIILSILSFVIMCLIDYSSATDFIASVLCFVIFYLSILLIVFSYDDFFQKIRFKNIQKALAINIKEKDEKQIIEEYKYSSISRYGDFLKKIFFDKTNTKRILVTQNEYNTFIWGEKLVIYQEGEYFEKMDYASWIYDEEVEAKECYPSIEEALEDCSMFLKDYKEEHIPTNTRKYQYRCLIKWSSKRLKKELPFGFDYPVSIVLKNHYVDAAINILYWDSLNMSSGFIEILNFSLKENTKFKIIENSKVVGTGKILI